MEIRFSCQVPVAGGAIRIKYGKQKTHAITVYEFCEHMGLGLEDVRPFLV